MGSWGPELLLSLPRCITAPGRKETTFVWLEAIYINVKTVWNPDIGEGNDVSEKG